MIFATAAISDVVWFIALKILLSVYNVLKLTFRTDVGRESDSVCKSEDIIGFGSHIACDFCGSGDKHNALARCLFILSWKMILIVSYI